MKKSNIIGPTGDSFGGLGQELRRALQAGKVSVNLFNIVQVGDQLAPPDQAARIARQFQQVLSGSAVNRERFDASTRQGSQPSLGREGVFHFDGGDTWQVGFSGHVRSYRDALGLHQVLYLLQRPEERVSAIELMEIRGHQVVRHQLCVEDVADAPAFAQWRERVYELRNQRQIAQQTANTERQAEVEIEMELLVRQLSFAQSNRGTRRRLGDQGDRLRQRVCYTIRSSVQNLIKRTPDLGEHLQASLKLGFECAYFPSSRVRWDF
jgi:hypothetical protein